MSLFPAVFVKVHILWTNSLYLAASQMVAVVRTLFTERAWCGRRAATLEPEVQDSNLTALAGILWLNQQFFLKISPQKHALLADEIWTIGNEHR